MTGHSPDQPETTKVCWLCSQHGPRLEHHVTETDHYPVRDCAEAAGAGVMLCPMCHNAVHQWMRAHGTPGTNAAAAALDAVLGRFTTALLT
ncbi:hypothetical protein ACX801_17965 [Arthrobacter bambusae]